LDHPIICPLKVEIGKCILIAKFIPASSTEKAECADERGFLLF
jgi:hypothetical protein